MKDLSKTETILVPHDFTQMAEFALLHANKISKSIAKPVTIAHIVKSEKEKKDATRKLTEIAEKNTAEFGVETKTIVAVGNYLTKIGEIGEIVKAALVIMGTHGVKGVQKFVGSYALKVITQSDIPYFVVQNAPSQKGSINNIVVPLDFTKESKQKMFSVLAIAELFKSKVHIVADYESDEFSALALLSNIKYAKAFLTDNGLDYEVHELGKQNNGLIKETVAISFRVQADLIVVMTSLDSKLSEFVMGASEQALITNDALIPVMCINPIKGSIGPHGMSIAHGG